LTPPGLARRARLRALAARVGPAALLASGARRLGLLRSLGAFGALFRFGLLAAQPFGGRAQTSADALRLGLLRRRGLFGLGVRVELAADQLDLRDLRAVAPAVADAHDA